jgi:carbonic anhydrase
MMDELEDLFERNRAWAQGMRTEDPTFFDRLARGQSPRFFWVGCSDSRVTPSGVLGLKPGVIFVHRNIANLVGAHDPNGHAALHFAVESLKVPHVIVCGHTCCGGMKAVLKGEGEGPVAQWLKPVQDLAREHAADLEALDSEARVDRLAELNVMAQIDNISRIPAVRQAWRQGQPLTLHGWIFCVRDGLLRDLRVSQAGPAPVAGS